MKKVLRHLQAARAQGSEAEGGAEAGFTLIELMVVLLIIAILLAIAIPTFLGVTNGANDRAAQSNLTNAFTEAAAVYQNNGQCFGSDTAGTCSLNNTTLQSTMSSSAPEFTWGAASASQNQIAVASTTDQDIELAVLSKTGYCWYIYNVQQGTGANSQTPGTYYGKSSTASQTSCAASDADGASGNSYSAATSIVPAG